MANQQIQQKENNKFKAFFSLCLAFFCIIFIFIFNPININNYNYGLKQLEAQAAGKLDVDFSGLSGPKINVKDTAAKNEVKKSSVKRILDQIKTWYKRAKELSIVKLGSTALGNAVGTALKQIAYDTATWLGNGRPGQKPLFLTEGWGKYLSNIADSEGGAFIEKIGKGTFGENFNICEPSLNVKYKIGLGLIQSQRPGFAKPNCTATEMMKNWGDLGEDLKKKKLLDFLDISATGDREKRFKNMQDAIAFLKNLPSYLNATKRQQDYIRIVNSIKTLENQIKLNGSPDFFSVKGKLKSLHEEVTSEIAVEPDASAKILLTTFDENIKELLANVMALEEDLRKIDEDANAGAENKAKDLNALDFLQKFQSYFNPEANDLGISLSLMTKMNENKEIEKANAEKELIAKKGWLDVRNLSGKAESIPGLAETTINNVSKTKMESLNNWTGDALVDAANVFLNQLAITAFNKAMRSFGKDLPNISTPYNYAGLLSNYAGAPPKGGASETKARLNKLIQPDFTVRGDYNILAELTMCPDPTKAGPTNCVIDDRFSSAITEKKTVGEALGSYLKKDGVFGFSNDGSEPNYKEGYPYRSMLILRKFRILPVGWEVAAQYIKDNAGAVGNNNTLEKLVACFDADDDYEGYFASWCEGLVDPNWVLKAPLNFCGREGPGPEIISTQVSGEGADSQLMLTRNDKYCADEQSCIKEKNNGSCDMYGYCVEERREWRFGDKVSSCEPKDNTCQTFRTSDGKTMSYLENTLDYGQCNIGNVGCNAYATSSISYSVDNDTIKWASSSPIYFDKDVQTCKQTNEGCNEFIRLKSGTGANLLTNSGFEDALVGTIWNGATTTDDGYNSLKALELTQSLNTHVIVGPDDYSVAGELFSLSFYAKNCSSGDSFSLADQTPIPLNAGSDWQPYQTSYVMQNTFNKVKIIASSSSCVIDNIKLERGNPTAYSDYRKNGLVYQKYAPAYLKCDGIRDPAKCNKYVMDCKANEVGCELYTSVKDDISIPAQAKVKDYCPAECIGYDTYFQSQSVFDFLRDAYFIPKTAKTCSATAIGCEEFTNLDELGKGAEAKEYYSALRQCVKPDQNKCADFYSWEGSDESGFQLRTVSLKNDPPSQGGGPAVTEADEAICNKVIYKLLSSNPMYQPNCRQFYNRAGQDFYHLINNTISCSDECHPYRLTAINNNPTIISSGACGGLDKHWDASSTQCMVCKSGGTWDINQSACVYMAIPSQGATCSASQNGCREYSGNTGNNLRFVLNNNFEGSVQDWSGVGTTTVGISSAAVIVGGHSLLVSGGIYSAEVVVGQDVIEGKDYVFSFIASSTHANQITVKLANSFATSSFVTATLYHDGNWHAYKVNLANLDHEPSDSEKLIITADADFYIDDIRLTEVVDRYYLIKDSWKTPDVCDMSYDGEYSPLYMLGCDGYHDRDNNVHNLHSFSSLCQESSVGCELMIDTKNSSDYGGGIAPADEFKYVVYNKKKQCNAGDKGCSRLGKFYQYATSTLYSDIYLKNNPDDYSKILCSPSVVGCQEWSTSDGLSYFKDPGDMVCEWRQVAGSGVGGWGWYKKKVKRCSDVNASVCLADQDCLAGTTCQLETNDVLCPKNSLKTFGTGGVSVYQPDTGWVGLCKQSSVGCSEYIDPISKFTVDIATSTTKIEPSTLYIFKNSEINSNNEINNCKDIDGNSSEIYELTNKNTLSATTTILASSTISKRFYSAETVECHITNIGGGKAELRKAVVGYELKQDLDKQSCNGLVDFEQGCILFNERTQSGNNFVGLNYNADITVNDGNGLTPTAGVLAIDNNSNVLIKVSPDRVCDKWLACKSVIAAQGAITGGADESVCENIGVCNKFNDQSGCARFIDAPAPKNQTYLNELSFSEISNMSGYAKVGWATSSVSFYPNDYYPLGYMTPEGLIANVPNGGFEFSDANNIPFSWTVNGGTGISVKTVRNPLGEDIATSTVFSLGGALISSTSIAVAIPQGTFYFLPALEIGVATSPITIVANTFYSNALISPSLPNYYGKAYGDVVYKNGNDSFYKAKTSLRMKKGVVYKIYNTSSKPVKIINNPIEAQTEKICYKKDRTGSCIIYTPEGRNFLKLTASYGDFSSAFTSPGEEISVEASSTYSISAYIDTSRLSNGTAGISVEQFKENSDGSLTSLGNANSLLSLENNNPWTFKLAQFTTNVDVSKIKITLFADDNPQGDFYFDSIDIKPVLKSQDDWYAPQSCRLYPKEDALSCDYEEDSGIRYKGWYGHCLEYDRYPGDPNVCLLWWSVPFTTDRVNEWCGDNHVNGQEDCEASSTQSIVGTSRNNQYGCFNCSWSNGWCGDNVIENIGVNYEQCDWNEIAPNTPNLNNLTCWNNPDQLQEFAHDRSYVGHADYYQNYYHDYLHGYLECNDSSRNNKCTVKISGANGCSDNLVVVANKPVHTREDCRAAGGVVWAEIGSVNWQVTDTTGKIIDIGLAGNEKDDSPINYFCKIHGGSCSGGMAPYNNWSATAQTGSYSGKGDDCGAWCGASWSSGSPSGSCAGSYCRSNNCVKGCCAGVYANSHSWSNTEPEVCSGTCNCKCTTICFPARPCGCTTDIYNSNSAIITAIGCY
ncbi:MAG: hypothetical protein V1649_00145 [Patescibacteria group bacterium]